MVTWQHHQICRPGTVQPYVQNPAKNGKVANTTGTNPQLKENKTKTKSDVNRKGPAGKLCVCVTGTEVQTQSGSPACSEPFGESIYASELGSAP